MLPILTENNPLISTMKEQVGDRVDHNLFEPPELPANPPPSPPSSITTEYGSDSRETAPAPAQGPPATPYVTRRPSAGEVSHQQALRRAQLEFSASAGPQHFPRIFSSSSSSSGGSSKNAPPSPTPPPLYPPAPPSPRGIYPVYACRSPSPSSPPSSSSSSSSSSAIPCIGSVRGSRRGESRVGAGGGGSSTCQPPPPPPPPLRFYDRMTLPPEIHHQPIAPARREQQQQQPAPHHHHLPSPSYRAQYAAELERLGALRLAQQAQAYERQKHHHHHQNQNQNQLLFADRVPEHSRGLDPLDRFVPGVVGFRD
ncbi:hypothetical protein F4780DRAFT_423073 [Xylariomycetidae sp. FL0641]|nr:hypothetical protein F4780DRAFT_423073 [Xylariomycetidae sp. FL0641]